MIVRALFVLLIWAPGCPGLPGPPALTVTTIRPAATDETR